VKLAPLVGSDVITFPAKSVPVLRATVIGPGSPGSYTMVWDLVHEEIT